MPIPLLYRLSLIVFAVAIAVSGCWSSGESGDNTPTEPAAGPSIVAPPDSTDAELPASLPERSGPTPNPAKHEPTSEPVRPDEPSTIRLPAELPLKADLPVEQPPVEQPPPDEPAGPESRPNPLRDARGLPRPENPIRPYAAPVHAPGGKLLDNRGGSGSFEPIKPGEGDHKPLEPITPAGGGRTPFDPIKENGPVFVGWPKPKLALVITGREDGYMEPCGCAGLDRMKGGLGRRHTMIRQELRERRGWPLVVMDVGGLASRYGLQAELKFQITVDAMQMMGYNAIGFGMGDLRLPATELVSVAASAQDPESPFVSANVGLLGFAAGLTARNRVVEAGGVRIGITSVLGKQFQKEIKNEEIELADPETALAQIVPAMKEQSDLMILLAYATKRESIDLARRFPDFTFVVTSGGPAEPPAQPTKIDGTNAHLIEVGEKGMCAIVIGLYDEAKRPFRYQRVPLDSRFTGSEDMKRLMKAYQDQLGRLGFEGLHLRPVSHPQHQISGGFVGSHKCQSCHEESYRIWKKTGHADAWRTLVELDPPRTPDPECISCHVVGWNPQKFFPYKGGFWSEKKTPRLVGVGCESCHGPGEKHAAAELGSDQQLQLSLRKAIALSKAEAQGHDEKSCRTCHDLDNSPHFDFETAWPKVEHCED